MYGLMFSILYMPKACPYIDGGNFCILHPVNLVAPKVQKIPILAPITPEIYKKMRGARMGRPA